MNTQLIAAVYGGGHIDYTAPCVTPLTPLRPVVTPLTPLRPFVTPLTPLKYL